MFQSVKAVRPLALPTNERPSIFPLSLGGTGPPQEVSEMSPVAKAATCPICGGILSGFRRDEILRFPVYYCPTCEAKKLEAPKVEVLPELDDLQSATMEASYPEAA